VGPQIVSAFTAAMHALLDTMMGVLEAPALSPPEAEFVLRGMRLPFALEDLGWLERSAVVQRVLMRGGQVCRGRRRPPQPEPQP
jgi:hypothetical protein